MGHQEQLKIAIVIGSTRPDRVGAAVGEWAYKVANRRGDASFALLDVASFNLPMLDEAAPAMLLDKTAPVLADQYQREHTRAWSAAVASCDGFVFVTPEYNHATSAALKNAIDFLYHEWCNKAAGFIGYGYTMGARAIENLRLVMSAVQVATVRPQVGLSLFADFENATVFKPLELQSQSLETLLNDVVAWSSALRTLREPADSLA
jgi:NAD(P)H-dependent FMN reductase